MLNAAILGAGFIGQSFIRLALQKNYSLRVLDHKMCPAEFEGKLSWVKGDLSNIEHVKEVLSDVDTVFHFISSTVPGDIADEASELIENVIQTLRLLKLCVQKKVQRIVFISSASVYGRQAALPISEMALTEPISSHGIHKLTIEKYLQLYKSQHGLDCKIIRLSNPYGPGQSINGRQGFVAIAIGNILASEEIIVRGDGSTIRDYVYIDDVCESLHQIANCQSDESVFNIGSGTGHSLNEVVATLEGLLGRHLKTRHVATRFVDIPASILDVSMYIKNLGQLSKMSFEQGLAKTLNYHGVKLASNISDAKI